MKRVFASIALAMALACTPSGTVHETAPVTKDLSAYRSASIAVNVTGKTEKPDVHKSQLSLAIEKQIKEKNLFAEVVPDKGDLEIRVNLDKIDEGGTMGGLAAGDTDVAASVELFDTKDNKAIGGFQATGTSKSNTHTSIGGVDTKTGSSQSASAHAHLAEQIATYIASHKAGAAK